MYHRATPHQPPEKKKSYKELREEQLAAEAAAKKAAEPPEVSKVQFGRKISSFNLKSHSNETGISAYFTERMLNTGD